MLINCRKYKVYLKMPAKSFKPAFAAIYVMKAGLTRH